MKTVNGFLKILAAGIIVMIISFHHQVHAQTDTTKVIQPDTTVQIKTEPVLSEPQAEDDGQKEDRKRKDEFVLYAGVNFNQLSVDDAVFESTNEVGYHLGGYYKRGKFFYWQAGMRVASASYNLKHLNFATDSTDVFKVTSIDIPLTAGVNILSATNRILALRLFVSADPTINLGVNDNNLGIEKDDINSFVLYGQGGVGVNVAFLVIEAGYNFGLQDLLKNDIKSTPGQVFVNLGFRF